MRIFAAITAIVGVIALALQTHVTMVNTFADGGNVLDGLWRLAEFFTIWSNVTATVVMAGFALWPHSRFADKRLWLVAVPSVVIAGVVFYTLLSDRIVGDPGYARLAQHMLHAAVPSLAVLTFLTARHGALQWRNVGWGVLPAAIYGAYILPRGWLEGSYPYWFVNAPALGWWGSIKTGAMLMGGFAAVSLVFIAADKLLAAVGFAENPKAR